MFDLKNNSVKIFDRSIPQVAFDSTNIMFELSEVFNTDKNMYYYMGLVLLRLGFEPEDSIVLSNYDKNNCSLDCVVNDDIFYKIRIDRCSSEIIMNTFNNEYGYVCEEQSFSEIGMRISLGRYVIKFPNGINFTRYLSRDDMKFKFEFDNYILELELEKPKELELPLFVDGIYAKYRLDNEEDLVEYMVGLGTNIDIVEIYKKLCESYIGDISKYPKFILKKSKKMDSGFKVTDIIILKDGELEQFGMTEYDRTVFLDKDDNWSYEMPMEGTIPVSFSLSFQNGRKSCIFSSDEDDDFMQNYLSKNIKEDIGIALNEVAYTKRRVLEIFRNSKGSN